MPLLKVESTSKFFSERKFVSAMNHILQNSLSAENLNGPLRDHDSIVQDLTGCYNWIHVLSVLGSS